MSDTYEIPDHVVDAIVEEGEPAEKAFRENAGVSIVALSESTWIPTKRLEDIEAGATATEEELTAIGDALAVPPDLLVDK